jgi:hypothetical protein
VQNRNSFGLVVVAWHDTSGVARIRKITFRQFRLCDTVILAAVSKILLK